MFHTAGCLRGCTDYDQMDKISCFTCDLCEFDTCDLCAERIAKNVGESHHNVQDSLAVDENLNPPPSTETVAVAEPTTGQPVDQLRAANEHTGRLVAGGGAVSAGVSVGVGIAKLNKLA